LGSPFFYSEDHSCYHFLEVFFMCRFVVCLLSAFFILLLVPIWASEDSLVVFVPQAKLREEPNFTAKVAATVAEGTNLVTTGKRHHPRSGEDHFGIIDESWAQVEHDGALLWVPRRDCLSSSDYQLISTAHKAGIAGDEKGMIAALGADATVSPDGNSASAVSSSGLSGVFHTGRGLVEWFGDEIYHARWSPDSRCIVLEVALGPRNVYDMQKERAIFAGFYEYRYLSFREEFVPGFYLYTVPGAELKGVTGEKDSEVYYQPQLWVVDLDSGEGYLLLEGKEGTVQRHGGAWSMEMEVKAKDVPDAVKAAELWQQSDGGQMVCPMMMDQGG
jgi:hypothetical protein